MPRPNAAGPKKGVKGGMGPKARALAKEFPQGTVLQDLFKKQWRLGPVIGQGGFGLIYLAAENSSQPVDKNSADRVVKIEPKENGPLYCEMHFYQRVARLAEINTFIKTHRLRYLSLPPHIAAGCHVYNQQEFRFLVMPRFGTDLQKLLIEGGGTFSAQTTFAVGLRMIDALQFVHEKEYVHADIKAANILTGFTRGAENRNEVYLVDFGLAYRYRVGAEHKEYKEDPRKAHDGTIEFTSRDAHKGVYPSRRGDIEILGYCMLQWLGGRLPWESHLSNQKQVALDKETYMSKPDQLVTACLHNSKTPAADCIRKYLEIVKKLKYDEQPNYKAIKTLLKEGMEKNGQKDEWRIDLPSKVEKRKSGGNDLTNSAKGRKRKSDTSTPVAATSGKGRKRKSDTGTPVAATSGKAKAQPKKRKAASPKPPKTSSMDLSESEDFEMDVSTTSTKAKTSKRAPSSTKKPPAAKATAKRKPRAPKVEPESPTKVLKAALAKKALRRASLGTGLKPTRPPRGVKAAAMSRPPKSSVTSERASPSGRVKSQNKGNENGATPKSPGKYFSSFVKLPVTKAKSSPKAVTKRKVKRIAAVQADASIQTSPGLLNKR